MSNRRTYVIPTELFTDTDGSNKSESIAGALKSISAREDTYPFAIGVQIQSKQYETVDLQKAIHVLISGNTGSGKSICLHSIILQLAFYNIKMLMIDLTGTELNAYNGIPQLVCPVIKEMDRTERAFEWIKEEEKRRRAELKKICIRDIDGYNQRYPEKEMFRLVIVIDNLDLPMAKEIAEIIGSARAVGIHFVCAARVELPKQVINEFPTKVALRMSTKKGSESFLESSGAEKLVGDGDMLYKINGTAKHLQGIMITDGQVRSIVNYLKDNYKTGYDDSLIMRMKKEDYNSEYDDRLPEAVEIVVEAGQASVSMLQRRMRVGYARAGRLIDEMEQRGIVSEADGSMPRSVLITRRQMKKMFDGELYDDLYEDDLYEDDLYEDDLYEDDSYEEDPSNDYLFKYDFPENKEWNVQTRKKGSVYGSTDHPSKRSLMKLVFTKLKKR